MPQPDIELGLIGAKISAEIGIAMAGFLGSVVSLKFLGPMPWYERVFLVGCGALCAQYLTPVAQEALGFSTAPHSISFIIGALGMSFMSATIKAMQNFGANPLDWLKTIFSRKP